VVEDFTVSSAYLGANTHVVTVTGELDVYTAPDLRKALGDASQDGAMDVVVDLLNVPFVDSVGLGVLVESSKSLKVKGGVLRIVCDDRRIARILEITGLDRVLVLHPTLRDALESLDGHGRPTAAATGP
jgi:anti-sigma B factor antagonist